MLHYPVRSLAKLRKKIIDGGLTFSDYQGAAHTGSHWRHDYAHYQAKGEAYVQAKLNAVVNVARAGLAARNIGMPS